MPRTLQSIVDEISASLPESIRAWPDPSLNIDAIRVGNGRLSFTVARQDIDDGFHMVLVRGMVPHLQELTEMHRWLPNRSDGAF